MLGDWIDEGPMSVVRVNCRWSEDGNFLIRTFTVKHQGKDVMTVTQRIGWDPAARQIRSWEFDSEGGFGEGRWGGDGDRWVIKHTATRPEGTTVSATKRWSGNGPTWCAGRRPTASWATSRFPTSRPTPSCAVTRPAAVRTRKRRRRPRALQRREGARNDPQDVRSSR